MSVDFELFQSGWFPQAMFPDLCEYLIPFALILLGGSSPDLVSSYACAGQYLPKYPRGNVPIPGATGAAFSSLVLCPAYSCQAQLSPLFSQPSESARLWLTLVTMLSWKPS